MKSIYKTLACLLGLAPLWGAAQGLTNGPSLAQRIDTFLSASEANGYAGTILVAQGQDVRFAKGYGDANRETAQPNTPQTIFNIGSVTKQFTAAAILKLREEGKLELSDPLGNYFPGVPEDKASITLHQLLTHTSGISPATGGFRYDPASKEAFLQVCFDAPLLYAPGIRHTYANANYILLAAVVESASGMEYEAYLQQMFFTPLGMVHTGYRKALTDMDLAAHGYYFHYTDGQWKDWGITPDHLPADGRHWFSIGKGDVYSTVEDLLLWHLALQQHRVLSKASLALMETPHAAETEGGNSYYGYGWAITENSNLGKLVTHNGSNGIYFADFLRFVDSGWVVISLSNTRLNDASEGVAWEISRMLTDADYQPAPIPKNSYELVFEFLRTHAPSRAAELPSFLKEQTGAGITDKALLNRIGLRQISEGGDAAWGLALLRLNTEVFPGDGNLWDSLGEGYYLLGQIQEASRSFGRALELGEGANCHWCEHASDRLQILGNAQPKQGAYFGLEPPGTTPELFAPGVVSTQNLEVEAAFAPSLDAFYFMRQETGETPKNYVVRYRDGAWQAPQEIETAMGGEVFISPDGKTMHHGNTFRERQGTGWSEPQSLGPIFDPYPIMRLTASRTGTVFFDVREEVGAIRYARKMDGVFEPPKELPTHINSGKWIAHPFIAPDESYLIWDAEREGGFGDSDLYISFKQEDGNWGPALNLGPEINTENEDIFGSVTPDGKYFIFQRIDANRPISFANIYWVDARVLEPLRESQP